MSSISNLTQVMYQPLVDEDTEKVTWEKQTIKYAEKHMASLMALIKNNKDFNAMRGYGSIMEPDDIYSDFVISLRNSEDYNIGKAMEASTKKGSDSILDVEWYVRDKLYAFIRSKRQQHYKRKRRHPVAGLADIKISEDGTDIDIFDAKASEDMDSGEIMAIEDACMYMECARYNEGIDLYLLVYISLLANGDARKIEMFKQAAGIHTRGNNRTNNAVVKTLIESIARSGAEKSREVLRKYIYGVDIIDEAFEVTSCLDDMGFEEAGLFDSE